MFKMLGKMVVSVTNCHDYCLIKHQVEWGGVGVKGVGGACATTLHTHTYIYICNVWGGGGYRWGRGLCATTLYIYVCVCVLLCVNTTQKH
jgi:hypothetical protein